jgi:long-chain acyl-CoA synthetase
VAGTHRGTYTERDVDLGQGFRNPYEQSKFEAEHIVRERSGSAPVQILRPSIVVGDSQTGWTPAFNVLYWPLRAFARGTYPVLPARRRAPVDVVPVDFVADAVLALAGRPGTTYHLTSGPEASSVGEVIELAARVLDRPAPRIIPPAAYRRTVHPLLVRSGAEARRRALRRSEAFFPYFAVQTAYDNSLARHALEPRGIEVPRLESYFERLIRFALAADWGRSIPGRHEASLAHRPPPMPPSPRPVAPEPGLSHAA